MAAGELSSAALTGFYLQRIDRLNPALHAVITVNLNAAAEAAASDAARAVGGPRGPLDGIPVLIKDNVQVAGMPTTAGSPALLSAEPERRVPGHPGCARPARSSSARPTCRSGPTSGRPTRPAAGPRSAARPPTRTRSTATRPARARARRRAWRPRWPRSRSAPRPTARSSAPPAPAASSASSPPTAWSAGAASCPSHRCRTPRDRWRPASPTRRPCCPSWPPPTPRIPSHQADADLAERTRWLHPARPAFAQALDAAALDGARLGIWRDPSDPAGAATDAVLDWRWPRCARSAPWCPIR